MRVEHFGDGGWIEYHDDPGEDGRILEKNAQGKIVRTTLSPSLAGAMGAIAHARRADRTNDVDALLVELSLTGTSARLLAENFVKGGAGAVGAARELFRMSRAGSLTDELVLREGEACPLCGAVRGLALTQAQVDGLLAYVDKYYQEVQNGTENTGTESITS
jgi:hypothetical protein